MTIIYFILKFISVLLLLYWPVVLFTSVMMFPTADAANHSGHVISTMAVVIYPIYICALYWMFDATLFTLKGRTLFISSVVVVFSGMGLFGYTDMLFNIAKNINSRGYTITEKEVYLDAKVIKGADPASFESLTANLKEDLSKFNSPYTKDKNQVYYDGKVIDGADPLSAKVLDEEFKWWLEDKDSLFFKGMKLKGIDSKNYELVQNAYILTPTTVYFEEKELPQVDRETFEIVKGRLSKDANHIYYERDIVLKEANAKSFQMFSDDSGLSGFGHDEKYLYDPYKNVSYPEIDFKSLKSLTRSYYKDVNGIYALTMDGFKKLEGVDASNFKVTNWDEETQSDANDGNLYFINGEALK